MTGEEQTSKVLELGRTLGGLRVRGWVRSDVNTDGATFTTVLEGADTKDADEWEEIASVTDATASDDGTFFKFIPDVHKQFMRVRVTATGATGEMRVAPELIP